jgi:hypothetical protein
VPTLSHKVYFRVPECDFRALEALCERYGFASVSDLVRTGIESHLGASYGPRSTEARLRKLSTRLQILTAETDVLARRVAELAASRTPIPISDHPPKAPAERMATCA